MQKQNEVSLLFFILIFDFKQDLSKLNMRNNAIFVRVFLSDLNKVVPKLLMTSASNQVPPSDTAQTQCKCEHQCYSADKADTLLLHTRMKLKGKKTM